MDALQPIPNRKKVVLVDANNFFASCERSFNPALEGQPVVVLSNNDGNVISRSEEAKELGVAMGEVFHHRKKWYDQTGVHYFSSNYAVYSAKSQQVIKILSRYTELLEYYSVDEAWLDVSHVPDEEVTEYCRNIRKTVWEEARIPCSFGIGRNKTQAKLAVSVAKKKKALNGVFNIIDHHLFEKILERVKVDSLWGINRRLNARLRAIGLHTAKDLLQADMAFVRKKTNVNVAKIIHELRGNYCFELQGETDLPQMTSVSLAFSQDTADEKTVLGAAACYVARAAARLRQNGMAARHVSVYLSTNRYSKSSAFSVDCGESLLPGYSLYTPDFIQAVQTIVKQCRVPGKYYHKVTVMLGDLTPSSEVQCSLFDRRNWEIREILMGLVDTLNEQFGEGSFRFTEEGERQPWKNRRSYLSEATIENMGLPQIRTWRSPQCRIGTDTFLVDGFR